MSNPSDPDPDAEQPPQYPADPPADPTDPGEPEAPATVLDSGSTPPATTNEPPPPPADAPPPAPTTIAPFPTAGTASPDAFGATPATVAPVTPVSEPPKGSGGRTLPWVLAGVFAIAALGLGIWGLGQKGNADDADDAVEQLRSDNDELDAQLAALKDGQGSVQDELDAANATASSLAAELETAQSDLATAQSDLATAQSDLDDANAEIAELETQLSAATSTTTSTSTTTTTTLPPDTVPAADPSADDGVVSPEEFAAATQALASVIPPGFTIEQAQDIANQACAAPDTAGLQAALTNIAATYFPSGSPIDAGLVTGGVAGFACFTHLQALTAG